MKQEKRHRVGLVLSGGGSRGVAHIGVIRALLERGIAADCVAGTSAGAIVGALYAAGYDPEQMLNFFIERNPFQLSKVAFAKPGIIDTAKVVADFEEYFPDNSFETLPRCLRIVATDLTRGTAEVFDSGPLIPAVLASSCFPVLFTPMKIGDRLFADGGIVSNFPSELIADRCRVLIGVHASPMLQLKAEEVSSSLAIFRRSLEIGMFNASRAKFSSCDVLIQPPDVARFGLFDIKHLQDIERTGYDAAITLMPLISSAMDDG